MLKSIEDGERKMARILSDGDLETRLGFDIPKSKSQNDTNIGVSKVKSKLNPFEQKPKRDAVSI